tara:strand:+ start:297 stop:497 length:201 start_codon:yes stop_codon:yes gene_type:complete
MSEKLPNEAQRADQRLRADGNRYNTLLEEIVKVRQAWGKGALTHKEAITKVFTAVDEIESVRGLFS